MSRRGRHSGAWKNVVLSRDEQFALKRTALLREAARAFSARGYHQTSLVDVAQTLGVTKAALYYYVSNKQEILYECHMMALDFGEQALAHALQHGRNGREKVVLLTQRYLELLTSEIGSCAVLAEVNALEPENRDRVVKRRDDFDRRFRQLINEGIADGSLRNVDPKLTVFFFMGAANWLTRWFTPDGEKSGAAIAAAFSDLLDRGIRAG
ncbi:TetR/AcrR family transcriptional regulator [Rhodoligotrophos defluvii]|uniref:TetR/AcrR family transcriptional regulator n=1 Tax=Rhodoligotrophos defluvii TaxID=2561934 RepID=UPI00148531F5|nr:TetR/AcrR family transcriptional regulator [Rhodoligotrophos defluvii]